jgi:hypothetical protein
MWPFKPEPYYRVKPWVRQNGDPCWIVIGATFGVISPYADCDNEEKALSACKRLNESWVVGQFEKSS